MRTRRAAACCARSPTSASRSSSRTRAGIVHRDLKPANIMLGDFGEVYVLDWGIARAIADADEDAAPRASRAISSSTTGDTRVGTMLGTPAYMAPEQLAGERAGPAADIYALGCILFEIVAGEPLHARPRSSRHRARPSTRGRRAPRRRAARARRDLRAGDRDRSDASATRSARALGDAVQAFLDGDRDVAVAQGARGRPHRRGARGARARRRRGEPPRRDARRRPRARARPDRDRGRRPRHPADARAAEGGARRGRGTRRRDRHRRRRAPRAGSRRSRMLGYLGVRAAAAVDRRARCRRSSPRSSRSRSRAACRCSC